MSHFTTENTLKLIYLFRTNECLWKITSKLYRRTDLKNIALKKIADEFNLTVEDIKRKIRNLRNTYVQQKKKLLTNKKSGNGVDELPKSKWFLFDELTFLDEVVVLRATTNSFESETKIENTSPINNSWDVAVAEESESQEIFEYTNELNQQENTQQTNKKVSKNPEKIDKYDAAITTLVSNNTPPKEQPQIFESFSSTVALQLQELHKMDASEAFIAMKDIQVLLGNKLASVMKNKRNLSSTCETCSSETNTNWSDFNTTANPSPMKTKYNNHRSTQFSSFDSPSRLHTSDTSSPMDLISPKFFSQITPTPSDSPTNFLPIYDTPTSSIEFNSPNLFDNISPTTSDSTAKHFSAITKVSTENTNYSSSPPNPSGSNFNVSKPIPIKNKTNVSYTLPLYSGHLIESRYSSKSHVLPESKRIKILEDVPINCATSSLLQNAMILSGVGDFEFDIDEQ